MRRKIVVQGDCTYTVSLPKKWATQNNLNNGDEININQIDDKIVMSAISEPKKQTTSININSENQTFIKVRINNLYRLGTDEIKVKYKTTKQAEIVEKVVNNLPGFEITEKNENKIIIENIMGVSQEKQKVLIRRIFLMLKETLDILTKELDSGKLVSLNEHLKLKNKIVGYSNYCRRIIAKQQSNDKLGYYYWSLYHDLSSIQYTILDMYHSLPKNVEFNKNVKEVYQNIQKAFQLTYNGFFGKKLSSLHEAHSLTYKMVTTTIPKLIVKNPKDALALHFLSDVALHIYYAYSRIVAIISTESNDDAS